MAKYKVGDKVKVRGDLVIGKWYGGEAFVESMRWSLGKIVSISHVLNRRDAYEIEESKEYVWTEKMFDFENTMNSEFDIKMYKSVLKSVILARHTENGKDYCFEIPQWIHLKILIDSKIEVETNTGATIMIASTPILRDVNIAHFEKRYGAIFPLKKVIGFSMKKSLKDIQISSNFKNNLPHSDKIKQCYEFYWKNHRFDRIIVIDENDVLVDGYVAYLVAKMVCPNTELSVIKRF